MLLTAQFSIATHVRQPSTRVDIAKLHTPSGPKDIPIPNVSRMLLGFPKLATAAPAVMTVVTGKAASVLCVRKPPRIAAAHSLMNSLSLLIAQGMVPAAIRP